MNGRPTCANPIQSPATPKTGLKVHKTTWRFQTLGELPSLGESSSLGELPSLGESSSLGELPSLGELGNPWRVG
jgi:hypothetical protein